MSFTAEQTAAAVGQLQWSSSAIAAVAAVGDDPRLVAVKALLDQQGGRWGLHLPESVLLRPTERVAPSAASVGDALASLTTTTAEHVVAVVARLIAQLDRELETLGGRVGPVADAAFGRALAETRFELHHAMARLPAGAAAPVLSDGELGLVRQVENVGFVAVAEHAEG